MGKEEDTTASTTENKVEDPKASLENKEEDPKESRDNKVEDSKASRTYKCDECEKEGASFDSNLLNVYENHILKHPQYKPFKCEKCSYNSHKKQNLHKHIKSIH